MVVTAVSDRTLYNGESVTLTCTMTLVPAVDSVMAVTVSWAGPDGGMLSNGGRVSVSGVTGSGPYQSTLTLSSLVTSDTGGYTCTASVDPSTPQVVASGDGTDDHTITIGKVLPLCMVLCCMFGYS